METYQLFTWQADVAKLTDLALKRQRQVVETAQGVEVTLNGRAFLNFCSNDYLGLAADGVLRAAFKEGVDRYGVGSGASHLVCGHQQAHHELEACIAQWLGRSRALLFSSGYMANVGVIQALLGRHDVVFEDRLNHASLLDGGRLSGAKLQRYPHLDLPALSQQMAELRVRGKKTVGKALVVTDSVFSMDGDRASLVELAQIAQQERAALMVDEAHALGVLGPRGAGETVAAGLNEAQVPIVMGTLGKALGCSGAFIAGSEALIEYLIQRARTFIYTTALPPALCVATQKSIEWQSADDSRRQQLQAVIRYFRQQAAAADVSLMASDTAIQPLRIGDSQQALRCSEQLRHRGLLVSAIRPPTVPAGTARLRITLSALHTEAMIDRLVDALASLQFNSQRDSQSDQLALSDTVGV